jgi:hypothetical protein
MGLHPSALHTFVGLVGEPFPYCTPSGEGIGSLAPFPDLILNLYTQHRIPIARPTYPFSFPPARLPSYPNRLPRLLMCMHSPLDGLLLRPLGSRLPPPPFLPLCRRAALFIRRHAPAPRADHLPCRVAQGRRRIARPVRKDNRDATRIDYKPASVG